MLFRSVISKDFQNKAKQGKIEIKGKVVHINEFKKGYSYVEKREDIDVVGDLAYGS